MDYGQVIHIMIWKDHGGGWVKFAPTLTFSRTYVVSSNQNNVTYPALGNLVLAQVGYIETNELKSNQRQHRISVQQMMSYDYVWCYKQSQLACMAWYNEVNKWHK